MQFALTKHRNTEGFTELSCDRGVPDVEASGISAEGRENDAAFIIDETMAASLRRPPVTVAMTSRPLSP